MKKNIIRLLIIAVLVIGANVTAVFAINTIDNANSTIQAEEINEGMQEENSNNGLGLIAVALATGLACIGSGIAVATVGASAVGAISENPKLLGKTIIFAGLAEGIAIYGLIISIMILNKI